MLSYLLLPAEHQLGVKLIFILYSYVGDSSVEDSHLVLLPFALNPTNRLPRVATMCQDRIPSVSTL